jgi:SnoaL-like domain
MSPAPDDLRTSDLVELHALCARYMSYTSQMVQDRWLDVFTPDAEYRAFGTPYTLERFPALLEAAPRGQFIGNMPVVELDGDRATGVQHFLFIDQQTHAMRLGWYTDEYHRTGDGWRIHRRSSTFMRKHGGFDSGVQHDPLADADADGQGARS